MKGQVGQLEHKLEGENKMNMNKEIGFKSLHYSVAEASQWVTVHVKNYTTKDITLGIRTKDDTAVAPDDYEAINEKITVKAENIHAQKIVIKNDEGWEPDEDFFVELYDPETKEIYTGDNASTKITILDDDKPGVLQFRNTSIKVRRSEKKVQVYIDRTNGSDGIATCQIKNEEIGTCVNPAKEFQDFLPFVKTLSFEPGVCEAFIEVDLEQLETTLQGPEEKDDQQSVIFYVKISEPSPAGVHISKRNICQVEIVPDHQEIEEEELAEKQKLIEYFVEQNDDSWSSQFKKAIILQPTINENDEIDYVTGLEAFMHLGSIGWKVLFALVPPFRYGGGWIAFGIALSFIGMVTAVVGEAATMFGCALGMKQSITAITFVALGTSLPDTFASMQAAKESDNADAAVGNVTGSNSVNVFLGLGIPWLIGVIYSQKHASNKMYYLPAGDLSFSVLIFTICSVITIGILLGRKKVSSILFDFSVGWRRIRRKPCRENVVLHCMLFTLVDLRGIFNFTDERDDKKSYLRL